MYTRIFKILFFISSSYHMQAQAAFDSFPLFNKLSSFELSDINQPNTTRIDLNQKRLSLFVFLSPECPLCQNYTKTINKLHKTFKDKVNIFGIIPGKAYPVKDVAAFENKYHTAFKILIDTKEQLTKYLKATVTPQAILLNAKGSLVYSGAIDDLVSGPGKKRLQPARNYVQDAIEQSLRPETVKIKTTKVFGCKINDY